MANESDHINKVFGSYRITAKIASGGFATVDGKERSMRSRSWRGFQRLLA